ncbi:MAG: PD-(D/E)XK nuclease family protein, partial [bacterium]
DDHLVLRQYVSGLGAELRSQPARDWMIVLVEKCLRPVCSSFHGDSNDDAMFGSIGRLLEQWRGYTDALERLGRRADVRTFVELSGLFGAQTGAPRGLPGTVGLYSCREAKGLFFPVVFMVGCSDLLFPSASDRQSLIPVGRLENLLAEVLPERKVSIYAARSAAKVLREQHHFLYIGLTRATRALHVTAPRNFCGDEYPAPCAILEDTVAVDYVCSTPHNDRIPPPARFARAWTAGGHDEALVESLQGLSPAGAVWHAGRAGKAPVPVDPFPLSKSSIEMFLTCKRQFFYRKLLGIPQETTAPARLGTLFHSVMAGLGQRFASKTGLHAGADPDLVRRLIDDALKRRVRCRFQNRRDPQDGEDTSQICAQGARRAEGGGLAGPALPLGGERARRAFPRRIPFYGGETGRRAARHHPVCAAGRRRRSRLGQEDRAGILFVGEGDRRDHGPRGGDGGRHLHPTNGIRTNGRRETMSMV